MRTTNAPTASARQPEKITVRSFKITQSKLDRFAVVAAANERTVSQQMRWLIDQNIKSFHATEQADTEPDAA